MISKLAFIIYFFVSGVVFTSIPWTPIWPMTVPGFPLLAAIFSNPILRGAVSGFGLVLIGGAIIEIRHVVSRSH